MDGDYESDMPLRLRFLIPNDKLSVVVGHRGENVRYLQNEYKVRVDTEPRQSNRTCAERDGIISIYKVNNSNREHTINDLMDAACCCHENRDLRIKYHSAINHDGTIYQIKLIIPEQLLSKLNDLNESIKKDTETANCQIANRNLPGSDERVVVIESDSRRELRSILKKFVSVLIDNKKGLVEYRVVFLGCRIWC